MFHVSRYLSDFNCNVFSGVILEFCVEHIVLDNIRQVTEGNK